MQTEIMGQFDATEIARVYEEIDRIKKSKRDYIIAGGRLGFENGLKLPMQTFEVAGSSFVEFSEAEAELDRLKESGDNDDVKIQVVKSGGALSLSKHAEQQLCSKLDVPYGFIQKLRGNDNRDIAN